MTHAQKKSQGPRTRKTGRTSTRARSPGAGSVKPPPACAHRPRRRVHTLSPFYSLSNPAGPWQSELLPGPWAKWPCFCHGQDEGCPEHRRPGPHPPWWVVEEAQETTCDKNLELFPGNSGPFSWQLHFRMVQTPGKISAECRGHRGDTCRRSARCEGVHVSSVLHTPHVPQVTAWPHFREED